MKNALGNKHGYSNHPLYSTWRNMIARCYRPDNTRRYMSYGGRGIMVCQLWLDMEDFVQDMGDKPEGFSLERKDVNLDYTPENCIWIPLAHQAKNRRSSNFVTMPDGRILCAADASREIGISESSLRSRQKKVPGSIFEVNSWSRAGEGEHDLSLREFYASGTSVKDIAAKLGWNQDKVYGRARVLGLRTSSQKQKRGFRP